MFYIGKQREVCVVTCVLVSGVNRSIRIPCRLYLFIAYHFPFKL